MPDLDVLRDALEQQRRYERENWPFDDGSKSPVMGEGITYHLVSLHCWSPRCVLALPERQRDERLEEIWRSLVIAGDIISRYERAVTSLLSYMTAHRDERNGKE